MPTTMQTIRIHPDDRKLLALFKLQHDFRTYTDAIHYLVERYEAQDDGHTQN
jgi:hypothetical protein